MMEYTINKLGKLAGVSTRTLRYYDEIDLLKPARVNNSGYRIYDRKQVDCLQQILFYRELGISLEDIRKIISAPDFDAVKTLENHLSAMLLRQQQLNLLIANVEKTILAAKGETTMSDNEKFEGFKQKLIDENEVKFGNEIREKYGDSVVNSSNAKFKNMNSEEYETLEKLTEKLNSELRTAYIKGDPASEGAQKVCDLHKQWLCAYWNSYSKEAHKGIAQTYVDDPRFAAYYDKIEVGCARFLRDAIMIYCK